MELLKCILHLKSRAKEVTFANVLKWFGDSLPWSSDRNSDLMGRCDQMQSKYDHFGSFTLVQQSLVNRQTNESTDIFGTDTSMQCEETVDAAIQSYSLAKQIEHLLSEYSTDVQYKSLLLVLDGKRPNTSLELLAFENIKKVNTQSKISTSLLIDFFLNMSRIFLSNIFKKFISKEKIFFLILCK